MADHPVERPTVIAPDVLLPESLGYRLKRMLLGRPLTTAELAGERLSNPVALGVLSPDCISSSAYGSEEMLRILLPFFGVAAFSLLLPVTFVILAVLALVTLSYREVVMVYTRAGGSYVVARENFGQGVAQIAAVALLIDYTVTVAVQTAAGTDALASAFPSLSHYILPIALASVVLICYGNLRGIREAGRTFAVPTYAFIGAALLVIIVGLVRAVGGDLPVESLHSAKLISIHARESALLLPISVFYLLKAFANGGSSLTGLEAISNGVSAFRRPEGRNARKVLVVMSITLGTLVLGVSLLAHLTHAAPYTQGTPTVISQEARDVFGRSGIGEALFLLVQAATMLVLFTGANTSFNGFPFLASFVAEDSFLPRQLTHRGHRLTFSNGILVLAAISLVLLAATGAQVDALVAVYAIGVFTGFTMAGSGMVKYHLREREPGWQRRTVINGSAAVASFAVVVIFAVTKFTEGAWVVVVAFPVLVYSFMRLNRRYRAEARALDVATHRFGGQPNIARTVCLVLVDKLDLATVRGLRYARSLRPDELRAVHFMIDSVRARRLQEGWAQLPDNEIPLDVIDCPDRRLARAALTLCAGLVHEQPGSSVTVLLPRPVYSALWGRLLHDRTADRIAAAVSRLRSVAATIVPYDPSGALERAERIPPGHHGVLAEETPGSKVPTRPRPWPRSGQAGAGPGPAAPGRPLPGSARPSPVGGDAGPRSMDAGAAPAEAGEAGTAEVGGPEVGRGGSAGDRTQADPGPAATGRAGPGMAETEARRPRLGGPERPGVRRPRRSDRPPEPALAPGCVPICDVGWRTRARVQGQVRAVETRPVSGTPVLEVTLVDSTGGIKLLFYGRRSVPGIAPGARLVAEGMVSSYKGRLAIHNPGYSLIAPEE